MKTKTIPNGTMIMNRKTGSSGITMNGYAMIPATGEWCEFEVETKFGIEIMAVDDMVVIDRQK